LVTNILIGWHLFSAIIMEPLNTVKRHNYIPYDVYVLKSITIFKMTAVAMET